MTSQFQPLTEDRAASDVSFLVDFAGITRSEIQEMYREYEARALDLAPARAFASILQPVANIWAAFGLEGDEEGDAAEESEEWDEEEWDDEEWDDEDIDEESDDLEDEDWEEEDWVDEESEEDEV